MITLTLAWLLLVFILSLILIPKTTAYPILKVIAIVATVWFSIAIFSLPGHFAGTPKSVNELPDKCIILSAKIIEPRGNDQGGMYFWVIEKEKYEKVLALDPRFVFQEINRIEPKSYKTPYNRDKHKKHAKAKGKKGKHGIMRYSKGPKKKKSNEGNPQGDEKVNKSTFEIINPVDLLPPKEEN